MEFIKISLLPSELKKQSSVMRRWTLVALILSVIAIIIFMVSFMFSVYLKGPMDELKNLQEENNMFTSSISRLSYIQEMFDSIEYNNDIISTLKGKNVNWEYAFSTVSNKITLYGITVRQIKIDSKKEGMNGLVIGECKTISNMTGWADSTRNLDAISSVELKNINKINVNTENPLFYFEADLSIVKWNEE